MDDSGAAQVAGATDRQPVDAGERNVTLDFIRGIAVLGILFPNIVAFGQPLMSYFWPPALVGGMEPADGLFWWVQLALVDGKFRGLFSLLFGAGIYLFLERAWARGAGRGLQARRLLVLLGFGLVHYFLIWRGDILTIYAVWGLIALGVVKWQAKTQLRVGLAAFVVGTLLLAASSAAGWALANSPEFARMAGPEAAAEVARAETETLTEAAREAQVYQQGSYADIVRYVADEHTGFLVQEVLILGPFETFGLILMGMGLYRLGLFSGQLDRRRMALWGWAGVVSGVTAAAALGYWPWSQGFPYFTTALVFQGLMPLPVVAAMLGLASLLALWAPTAAETTIGRRFVAAGRMAFSNYLGTSIVMMFVFHGWAGGLWGQLHRPQLLLVVLATWVLMLAWSPWWLARFRYGPLEWLWRCLTYGKLFSLRRKAT